MIIKLLVEGGSMKPGPALSQQLGPAGINIGKVIQDVNTSTKEFQGMKVPVELDINTGTKDFTVKVFSPPVSELIKKELKLEKASGEQNKIKVGNLAIEQVIKVAKIKHPNMLDTNLKKAVKSVIGTCVSLGILIENKEATAAEKQIEDGKYDSEIKQEKTEVSPEKKSKLDKHFSEVKKKQDELIRKEEEEKAAEEEKKAKEAETPTEEQPAEGEVEAKSGEAKAEEKPAEEEKK